MLRNGRFQVLSYRTLRHIGKPYHPDTHILFSLPVRARSKQWWQQRILEMSNDQND